MPTLHLNSTVKLNNGVEMPVLGLGTFQSARGRVTRDAVSWALEKGYVVIPKSVHRERILENSQVFDFSLSPEELKALDGLNEDLHTIRPPFMEGEWD